MNNGSVGKVCAQASGAWNAIAQEFAKQYFTTGNQKFNYTAAQASLPNATVLSGKALDGRTTEDCLFLDVFVPEGAFDECEIAKLPVYVYVCVLLAQSIRVLISRSYMVVVTPQARSQHSILLPSLIKATTV